MADELVDLAPEELYDLFEHAAAYLRHNAETQSSENLLHFYAHYKQVVNSIGS